MPITLALSLMVDSLAMRTDLMSRLGFLITFSRIRMH